VGFRSRIKGALKKSVLGKVVRGAKAVHEESKYPGRPASYQAADNPLWQDEDVRKKVRETAGVEPAREPVSPQPPAPAAPVSAADPGGAPPPTDRKDRNDEPFWFMDGEADLDGWDQTNPSEEWRKRHGVEGGNE